MKKINFVVIVMIMFVGLVPSVYAQSSNDFRGVGIIPMGATVNSAVATAEKIGFTLIKKEPDTYSFVNKDYLSYGAIMQLNFKAGKLVQGSIGILIPEGQTPRFVFQTFVGAFKEIYPKSKLVYDTTPYETFTFSYEDFCAVVMYGEEFITTIYKSDKY